MKKWVISVVAVLSICVPLFADFVNPSFEGGMNGWRASYYKGEANPCTVVSPGYKSRKALRIVSRTPLALTTIEQQIKLPDPSKQYRLTFDMRYNDILFKRYVNVRAWYMKSKSTPINMLKGRGWAVRNGLFLYRNGETARGEWTRNTYVVPAVEGAKEVNIQIEVLGGTGTVWLDNFALEEGPKKGKPETLFYFNAFATEWGVPPYTRLQELTKKKSPFLDSGDRFNALMVTQSNAREVVERLGRARFYLGEKPETALKNRHAELTREMEKLYEKFGTLYISGKPEKLSKELNGPVDALKKQFDALMSETINALVAESKHVGIDEKAARDFERKPQQKPIVMDRHGNSNQLLFGLMSKPEHFDMERVLGDVRRIHSFNHGATARRASDKKSLNFDSLIEPMDAWRARGVEVHNVLLPFTYADKRLVIPEFFYKNWDNPDIFMQRNYKPPKTKLTRAYKNYSYNIFNPAVRESCRQAAAEYGKRLKGYKKIYISNWEDYGPQVEGRAAGYGKNVDRAEFRKHLQKKFGTIEKLNSVLRTKYVSFEEIKQPVDKRTMLGNTIPRGTIPICKPLHYELDKWRHQVYNGFARMIYEEIKKHDPDAVVLAGNNGVFSKLGFDPMSIFECSDMVGNHAYPYVSDIFRSLRRFAPEKTLGVYEDQFGLYEDFRRTVHRPGDDMPGRNYTLKHVGRIAGQEFIFQSWWYSYSRGAFILTYGAGQWANPVYDLTIFRYFITGLPTGIRVVRRFEDALLKSRKVASRIVLLIPETTFHHQYGGGHVFDQIRAIHHILYSQNYQFESVPEKLLLEGKADLSEYDIVISPFAAYFPKGLWSVIDPWIKKGGHLVSLGPSGLYDEHGFEIPNSPMKPLINTPFPEGIFNKRLYYPVYDWEWENGSCFSERAYGKGKIAMTSRPVLGVARDTKLLAKFMKLFEAAKRNARSADTPVELTMRKTAEGKRFLFALNPNGDATIRGKIEARGKYSAVRDLSIAGGFPVTASWNQNTGYTEFSFQLAPGCFTMFSLGDAGK